MITIDRAIEVMITETKNIISSEKTSNCELFRCRNCEYLNDDLELIEAYSLATEALIQAKTNGIIIK